MSRRIFLAGLLMTVPFTTLWAGQADLSTPEVTVVAKHLDDARNALSPDTGASTYTLDEDAIADLPLGANTQFNQILFQTPGAVQDSMGQVHIRGEHGDLQYRINGILLPEGISGYGPTLDPRIVDHMSLITGALPAQYGYRTAGVVDIHTKDGAIEPGGTAELMVGSHGTVQPSISYGASSGPWSLYASGSFANSDYGIEPPTSKYNPLHDGSDQGKGFAYLSYAPNPFNRVNVIVGSSVNRFEIPNNPGQQAQYSYNQFPVMDSGKLKETQVEQSHYGTVALQGERGDWTYQAAPYLRWSQTHFHPDLAGDLEFNGIASDVNRSDIASGFQADAGWKALPGHTLRAGIMAQHDSLESDNSSLVFPVNASGTQTSTIPRTVVDNTRKEGMTSGVYLQDEWNITQALTLNYGVRFDWFSAFVTESQLSPRVGLVYQVTDSTTLHGGYARNFTPPPMELIAANSVMKFAGTSGQASNTRDDPVHAERTHSFDVGVSHQLDEHIKLGLDSYLKISRNLLDEGQFGSALLFTPFNYREGQVSGVEGTVSYADKETIAYLNIALSRAVGKDITSSQFTFSDQTALSYIQNHWIHLDHDQLVTGSAGITQKLDDLTKISLDGILGSGLHVGFANQGHMPWYTQLNFGITRHLPVDDKGVDVRLSVVNVLDTPYQINDGSGIGVAAPHWGPRRSFFFTMAREF